MKVLLSLSAELLNEYDVVDGMDIGLSLISCQLVFASRAGEGDFSSGQYTHRR